jgi:GGDEF domain-containing protein
MAAGASAGAAAAAAIANANKASGVLVRLEPEEFAKILARAKDPLVVVAQGGFFSNKYQYLMSYKGLAFYCKADEPLQLPAGIEVVSAGSIWIPG